MDIPDKVPMCLNNQHVKAATGYLNEGSCVHKCMQHGCTRILENRYLKIVCSRAPPVYLTVDFCCMYIRLKNKATPIFLRSGCLLHALHETVLHQDRQEKFSLCLNIMYNIAVTGYV
jgi:hypothetical protein